MNDSVIAFLPVVLTLVLTPGVNNLVVLASTLAGGRRGGTLATAGTTLGVLTWASATALGLGALATSSPTAWLAVQWLGAATLMVLGVRGVLRGRRRPPAPEPRSGGVSARGSFLPALGTSVLNPRAAITAVAVLPQFVAPGAPTTATTLVLGLVWAGLAGAWNLAGVALALRGRQFLNRPAARRTVEAAGGGFLVVTALSVVMAT